MSKASHCSFCRAPRQQCAFLIQGPEAAICGACVVVCVSGVMNPQKPEAEKTVVTPPLIVRP